MTRRWRGYRIQRRIAVRLAALLALAMLPIDVGTSLAQAARIVIPDPPAAPGACAPGRMITAAGNGRSSYSGDDGPGMRAAVYQPCGVAAGADGSVYIADTWNNRVRKVGPDGMIATVAGDGWQDDKLGVEGRFQGDGDPATEASLCRPHGVAVGADGSVYIADSDNNRVRKADPKGIITTVAGVGMEGYSGDGGPARWARLNWPRALAVGPDGSLYICDTCNHRVRKVDPNGIISTIAGDGEEGYWGDGGPALKASLYFPRGVAVAADGSLYIADYGNNRIRKVDPNGIITTVAGNGSIGQSGDGGRATDASLYHPRGVAVGPDGGIYIADTWNNRIRRIDPNGTIGTVAGSGREGFSGDGQAATSASLRSPEDVTVAPDGTLYIADRLNNRVRKVCPGVPVPIPPTITILDL